MLVSIVASKSTFSTRGRMLNCYGSSLSPKTVEAYFVHKIGANPSYGQKNLKNSLMTLKNLSKVLL